MSEARRLLSFSPSLEYAMERDCAEEEDGYGGDDDSTYFLQIVSEDPEGENPVVSSSSVPPPSAKKKKKRRHRSVSITEASSLFEVLLFFACGVGGSLCYISTLSSLVYFQHLYGPNSYVYLNLAIYVPLVPIALAQARWDQRYDMALGSYTTFVFRGVVGFVISVLTTASVPFTSHSRSGGLTLLIGLATLLGTAGAVLQGTLSQMASFVSTSSSSSSSYGNNGTLKAAVSAGFQASALLALIVSLSIGFGSTDSTSTHKFHRFFYIIAALECVLFGLFLVLMYCSHPVAESMVQRDSSIANLTPLLEGIDEVENAESSADEAPKETTRREGESKQGQQQQQPQQQQQQQQIVTYDLTYRQLWAYTWPCCIVLVITLTPSFMVGSWFTHVKTNYVPLPQILFYTRIALDFIGRPTTLVMEPKSVPWLIVLSILRLPVVVLFFVNASTDLLLRQYGDALAVLLAAIIAFMSGYLVTGCFQLAPTLLPLDQRDANGAKQTSLLNAAFSLAALGGLLSSFLLLGLGL